ncbi:hypothetical protein ACFFX0_11465 [Citricoccus parietis]|uniref:Uncharacterized protein n=1 Tax=Citricoccus parietis TaxID=592307 RepID=A0ABV5FYM8_9MICC
MAWPRGGRCRARLARARAASVKTAVVTARAVASSDCCHVVVRQSTHHTAARSTDTPRA